MLEFSVGRRQVNIKEECLDESGEKRLSVKKHSFKIERPKGLVVVKEKENKGSVPLI